jgi:hypothetical protein
MRDFTEMLRTALASTLLGLIVVSSYVGASAALSMIN